MIYHRCKLNVSSEMKSSKKCYRCQFTTCAIKLLISESLPSSSHWMFSFHPNTLCWMRSDFYLHRRRAQRVADERIDASRRARSCMFLNMNRVSGGKTLLVCSFISWIMQAGKEEARMIKLNYATFSRRRKLSVEEWKKGELKRASEKALKARETVKN